MTDSEKEAAAECFGDLHVATIVATPGYDLVYREPGGKVPRCRPIYVWGLVFEQLGDRTLEWVVPMQPAGATLQPMELPEDQFIRIKQADEAFSEVDWEMAQLLYEDEEAACLSATSSSDSSGSQDSCAGKPSSSPDQSASPTEPS